MMKLFNTGLILAGLLCLTALPFEARAGADDHDQPEETASDRGPNGGVLLSEDGLTLELLIYEQGAAPHYRAWITRDGEAVTDNASLRLELERLGGKTDAVSFSYGPGYWLGDGMVAEPHSFTVTAQLQTGAKSARWRWDSFEGRTEIDQALASEAGIQARRAGPGTIERTVASFGRLVPNPNAIAHVRARFDGEVKRVAKGLGDRVEVNEVLATIESNQSLKPYAVRAPIAGTITARHITVGELTQGQELFAITNLTSLWVELKLFPEQSKQVKVGSAVHLDIDGTRYQSRIKHLLPGPDNTPYIIAHAELDNSAGTLSPGRLVSAEILVSTIDAPLVIENRALQSFRDWTVAFVQVDDTYEIRPLQTGHSDGEFTEVRAGLQVGDRYVVENSYLIKADIEKSGASHDH